MIFDNIIENVMNNYYTDHKQGKELLALDLSKIYDEFKEAENAENCVEEIEELEKTIRSLEEEIEYLEEALYE